MNNYSNSVLLIDFSLPGVKIVSIEIRIVELGYLVTCHSVILCDCNYVI